MKSKNFWMNWHTTAPAVGIILTWTAKYFGHIEVPTEVASAITAVLVSIGLLFAGDAKINE